MDEQAQTLLATRTVSVRFPSGETEYWLTDRGFAKGDAYTPHGDVWEVAEVLPRGRNGREYLIVKLMEPPA